MIFYIQYTNNITSILYRLVTIFCHLTCALSARVSVISLDPSTQEDCKHNLPCIADQLCIPSALCSYNQVTMMSRYYKRPILLIEFSESRSFSLQSKTAIGSDISINNVSSKLVLLTIHFPKVQLFNFS